MVLQTDLLLFIQPGSQRLAQSFLEEAVLLSLDV